MGWLSTVSYHFRSNKEGQALLEKLKLRLTVGLAFIGENHEEPYARAVVCDLITEGRIKTLFLEDTEKVTLGTIRGNIAKDYVERDDDDKPLGQHLRSLVTQKVPDIKKNIGGLYSKEGTEYQEPYNNVIPITVVYKWAIRNGVPIHFHDTKMRDMKLLQKEKGVRMDARNEASAAAIKGVLGSNWKNTPRAAVLIGAGHFREDFEGEGNAKTIQGECDLGGDSVFDFSRYRWSRDVKKLKRSEIGKGR